MQDILACRDKFVQQRRREHFDRLIKQERRNFHLKLEQEERDLFAKVYPKVDEDNYPEYRQQLVEFVVNPAYSYQLLVFTPIIYGYLMENPSDGASITLLKFLSQYEDI